MKETTIHTNEAAKDTSPATGNKILLQPKLTVGETGSSYEKEADATADKILRMPETNFIQRKCADCEEEEEKQVQRKEFSQTSIPTIQAKNESGTISDTINATKGAGSRMDTGTLSFMQSRFGANFNQVRIHTDDKAIQMSRELNAKAFTTGNDIYFNKDQYQPGSDSGKHLLAHELTHTLQQGQQIRLKTMHGTEDLHRDLIEQFRRENGFPPNGIDPYSGQSFGPTDSEIRFGGLLEAWLAARNPTPTPATVTPGQQGTTQPPPVVVPPTPARPTTTGSTGTPVFSVPAPATAPAIGPMGTTNVVPLCANATNVFDCEKHQNYVQNILPQAIANIRLVSSPYNSTIADMYASALTQAQAAATPGSGRSLDARGGPVTVTVGSTSHTFTTFVITLDQRRGGNNGQALSLGLSPTAFIILNEFSADALNNNLSGIETTMVHEGTHILMEIVETNNASRAAGTAVNSPNLDRASYATIQTGLEAALLPFVTAIRQIPSFTGVPLTAAQDATATARSLLSEAIARTEGAIYENQRQGLGFTASDVQNMAVFTHLTPYWSPTAPVGGTAATDLQNYMQTNQTSIIATLQPFMVRAGETYLNQRP
jgi:hypothetical protein